MLWVKTYNVAGQGYSFLAAKGQIRIHEARFSYGPGIIVAFADVVFAGVVAVLLAWTASSLGWT
jgi:hypothetical protein